MLNSNNLEQLFDAVDAVPCTARILFFPLVTEAFPSFELPDTVTSGIEYKVQSQSTDIPYL